jgi:hypothetical protein
LMLPVVAMGSSGLICGLVWSGGMAKPRHPQWQPYQPRGCSQSFPAT